VKNVKTLIYSLICSSVMLAGVAYAGDMNLEVTITNLTRGSNFTPVFVAAHKEQNKMFTLGDPASAAVADMAEGGATSGLPAALNTDDFTADDGLLGPGESVTLMLSASKKNKFLSVASMLLPTNDAFFAVNGIKLPKKGRTEIVLSPAYDAGSEANDELCDNIPGPTCGGTAFSDADDSDEGYVHIHAGIHGIGDLAASVYDWRNPVARIVIKALK